jgi:hypothetical protein
VLKGLINIEEADIDKASELAFAHLLDSI